MFKYTEFVQIHGIQTYSIFVSFSTAVVLTCIKTQMIMKKILLTIIAFCTIQSFAQVGIGTTNPHVSSILDLTSTTQGFLVPRLTTAQRDAITSPANGLMIYNTSILCFEFYNATVWQSLCNTSIDPAITSIPCTAPFTITPAGNGVAGLTYNKTVTVPYNGGNGAAYPTGIPIASIGVTGLTATLNAGILAAGAGNFTFTVTGTPDPFVSASTTATATFPFTFDGKSCSFTITINKASIAPITCSTAVVESPATGINGSPYIGTITVTYPTSGNGGGYNAQSIPSTGVTGLTATIAAGFTNPAGGTLVFNVSGTPSGTGNARFNLSNFITNLGCSGADVQIVISGSPIVTGLNCSAATHLPTTATQFSLYSGTTTLPYIGGNGVAYPTQTINSTGVLGLTATLTLGTLASGNGNLSFTVSGTPTSSGFASFAIIFGGQTCVFSIRVNGRQITIDYIDDSSFGGSSRKIVQQYVPSNYGPSGVFNTIGGIGSSDFTSTFNAGISALTMRNTREVIACGPNKTASARSLADCQRIRDYVALGGVVIITLDGTSANTITTSNNYHAAFGGTGTFTAGANPTTINSTIPQSSTYWGTANAGIALEGTGVSAEFSGSYSLPIGAQVLATFTNGKPAVWTCGEGNRALFICDDGLVDNATYFTTSVVNTDQEKFFHNLLKNYILVHLGF